MTGRRVAAVVAMWLVATTGIAADIVGRAAVVDGDSLEIGDVSVRLFGIDAPEGRQTCQRSGAAWSCGEAAARRLGEVVAGRVLRCEQRDRDDYGRIVAVCRAGGQDVNEAMVAAGLALAYRRYSVDYVAAEDTARRARRGLWASEFTPPWEFRAQSNGGRREEPRRDTQPPATAPSAACRIKGNINDKGERIYHVPGRRAYDATRIDTAKGERWFCSEREAVNAGWRAPRG